MDAASNQVLDLCIESALSQLKKSFDKKDYNNLADYCLALHYNIVGMVNEDFDMLEQALDILNSK